MPMPTLTQSFDHALDYLKGWWEQHNLDISGRVDSSIDATARPLVGGRVVHVSQNMVVVGGQGSVDPSFKPGAVRTQMPIFLHQNETDPDVRGPGYGNGQTDPNGWTTGTGGHISGLVATGGFELQSTEFDRTNGVTWNANDPLHSPTEEQITGADKSKAGMIYNKRNWPGGNGGAITPGTDNVCGIVSRGRVTNHNRRDVISFWTLFWYGTEA